MTCTQVTANLFCWRNCFHWSTCFTGSQGDSTENVGDLDSAVNETSVEPKLSPSQRFSRRVAIGELEKYVKEGLTSGEMQRQHAVRIIHQPISFWNFVAVVYNYRGICGGTVGWGTALPAGRLRVWFLIVSFEFSIDIILPAALWPWGWLSL